MASQPGLVPGEQLVLRAQFLDPARQGRQM